MNVRSKSFSGTSGAPVTRPEANRHAPPREGGSGVQHLWVAGVDGCRGGWFVVLVRLGSGSAPRSEARLVLCSSFSEVMRLPERFIAVTGVKGGALQEKYDQLESEYEQSEARATDVHRRVAGVEEVAEALFDEWEAELDQYTSAPLRRSSERRLQETRAQYKQLIQAMKRAEAKMDPVLAAFHDQVLFLKHNLNAQAIASLKGNLASIESDIAVLIREMEASIREANRFIDAMNVEQVQTSRMPGGIGVHVMQLLRRRRPAGRKPGRAFVNKCSRSKWNIAPSAVAP